MRTWAESACVVLAWSVLSIILVAAGMNGSVHPGQANTRTAGSSTEVILTSAVSVAASPVTATSHTMKYVVRSGDTLSGIAARFAVHGGWPALYAANRRAVGPDPDIIHAGTVLVLPGRKAPVRYTVAAGDTLSGIAAEFAVRGGWPALYAANRRAVGSDPNVIHAGTVLTFPHPPAPAPPTPGRSHRPTPPPSPPAGPRHHPLPVTYRAPAAAGMPQWLTTMLLAVGLLILAAFLAEPVLVVRRRRRPPVPPRTPMTRVAMWAYLGQAEAPTEPFPAVLELRKAVAEPCTALSGLRMACPGQGAGLPAARHREGSHRPGRL